MQILLRRTSLVILAVAALGCARVGQQAPSARCPATRPSGAVPFDRGKLLELGGSYQLLTVNTTTGYDDRPVEGSLRLATNDTLSRFYLPTSGGYQRRGDRLLAGTYQGREAHRDTVVVQAHILSVGCQFWMCTDASPTQYRIEWVADDAFGGTWENYQSGIARAVDKQGHLLPNPSGHFCARRIGL